MQKLVLDKEYWNSKYERQQIGWDLGTVSIPLKEYLFQLADKNIAILIPGCGNAHEAEFLLQHGFTNVTVIDIAPIAVEAIKIKLKEYDNKELHVICGDFFELNAVFDLIIEQTFFCALDPLLRKAYRDKMFDLLSQEGKLAGLLFNRIFEDGPPFWGSREEYLQLFSSKFTVKLMEECHNSIIPREGSELFFVLVKPTPML